MEKTAIKGLSLTFGAGEFVAVIGGAGSGKSTFIQLLGGLLTPTSGRIVTSFASGRTKSNDVGVVFQFPEKQFFEETVYSDLSYPLRRSGISEEEIEGRVKDALSKVDMKFHAYRDRSPMELSSGEKRRVAIAAILVLDTSIIALDEPFAGLDYKGKNDIFYELKRLQKATGKTVIIATQDLEAVSDGCDRGLLLEHGSVIGDGAADLLKNRLSLISPIVFLVNILKSKGLDLGDGIYDAGDAFLRIKTTVEKGKSS